MDMMDITLDMRRMGGKAAAHAYLARKLNAPDWYGANLDALYDLLTSLPPARVALRYSGSRAPSSYQAKIIKVFADASQSNPSLVVEYR